MVDIRAVCASDLKEGEVSALVEIYKSCFGTRMSLDGAKLDTVAQNNVRYALDLSQGEDAFSLVAYDSDSPVGFLFAESLRNANRIIWRNLVSFSNSFTEPERQDYWMALNLNLRGKMSTVPVLANPSGCKVKLSYNTNLCRLLELSEITRRDLAKMATAVHPDCRGNGVAKKMNEALEEIAQGRGASNIVTVCTDNPFIRQMNEEAGFVPVLGVKPYYADLSEGVYMIKFLPV